MSRTPPPSAVHFTPTSCLPLLRNLFVLRLCCAVQRRYASRMHIVECFCVHITCAKACPTECYVSSYPIYSSLLAVFTRANWRYGFAHRREINAACNTNTKHWCTELPLMHCDSFSALNRNIRCMELVNVPSAVNTVTGKMRVVLTNLKNTFKTKLFTSKLSYLGIWHLTTW
jgi:hypothetical protein